MAINGCTIDGFTLHGFKCRDKFSALIPILHPAVQPSKGAGQGGWFQGQGHAASRQRWEQPEVPKNLPTELERITITASFQGVLGTATQEITPRLDLVTVTDIHVNPIMVSVNIENFSVHQDPNWQMISVNIENFKVNQDAKSINKQ
jgi:hypothetical protein